MVGHLLLLVLLLALCPMVRAGEATLGETEQGKPGWRGRPRS